MTSTVDSELNQQRLQQLADRNEITDLVSRLGQFLDDRRFDDMRSLLVEHATVRTPGGAAEGREAVVAQAKRNHHPDEPTQHLITNVLVDLDGDRAAVRANLVVNFAAPTSAEQSLPAPPRKYTFGETYRFDVVRTTQGWRFFRIQTTPVWIAPLSAAFLAAALRRGGTAEPISEPE
jgi:3-phenylpropionate/cinnamic acid dioxygenase small subunit